MEGKKVVYVAYSPYENQGRVLEFILKNFSSVYLFSIVHHDLKVKNKTDKLIIYEGGRKITEISLLHIPIPSSLVFSIVPLRSLLNFIQIMILLSILFVKNGKMDLYFSVNGYAAWMGLVFKKLGFVDRTSYWVCDYYPIHHRNRIIRFIRWVYWKFEKLSARSDILSFHNQRLVKVWRKGGAISDNDKYHLVPIGTEKSRVIYRKKSNRVVLVFLGVLKKSQGLDFIFDSSPSLRKAFPNLELNVLGPGPETEYFRKRASETGIKTKLYGFVSEKEIDRVISHSTIGIAPYIPDTSSVSYYGDPGKIKRYISLGLPVIATNIHEFSKQIEKAKAGMLVHYNNSEELVNAIKKINSSYQTISRNAIMLNDKYYFQKLYPVMFGIK